jgi:membrane protein required for colicin V production
MFVDNVEFWLYDAGVLIMVLLSFVIGWIRGATKEVFSVVAWIGGVYLTVMAFPHVQGLVKEYIKHGLIADFVAACGLFVAFLTVLSVVNHLCSNFVRTSMLRGVDNVLGGIFGLVRGVAILAVVDIVISQYFAEQPKIMKEAKLQPVVSGIANMILLALPDGVQHKLLAHMSQIRKENLLDFIKENIVENIATDTTELQQEKVVIPERSKKPVDDHDDSSTIVNDAGTIQQERTQTAEDLASLKPRRSQAYPQKKQNDPPRDMVNDMHRILDSISTTD